MASFDDLTPDIKKCLEQFRTAVLGEDVRGALINAIKLCYHDIITYATNEVKVGKSAFELAQDQGYTGSLQDWLDSLKGDQGPKGDKGDKGDPGEVEAPELTVDGSIDGTSPNPVQNRVIKAALDTKMNKVFTSPSDAGKICTVNGGGMISASTFSPGNLTFKQTTEQRKTALAREAAVTAYAYSKTESDSKYLTEHQDISGKANADDVWNKTISDRRYVRNSQIDSKLSPISTNPVQNRVIKAAIDNITPPPSVVVDDHLDQNSTNPVQNKVVKAAIDHTANEERIYELIDAALSFDDPNNTFSTFNLNGLFVERYLDQNYGDSGATKYRYYLTYIDSDSDAQPQPGDSHWHRIIELTGIFESNQWKCQDISTLPQDANPNKYYPSVGCMMNFVNGGLRPKDADNLALCVDPDILYKVYYENSTIYVWNVDTVSHIIDGEHIYDVIDRIQYGLIGGHLMHRILQYDGTNPSQARWELLRDWSQ